MVDLLQELTDIDTLHESEEGAEVLIDALVSCTSGWGSAGVCKVLAVITIVSVVAARWVGALWEGCTAGGESDIGSAACGVLCSLELRGGGC